MVNKRGWLRIVEASISVMVILGMLFFLTQTTRVHSTNDISEELRQVLNEVAENSSLRDNIYSYQTGTLTLEQEASNDLVISKLKNFIGLRINQPYLNYTIKICSANEVCGLETYPENTDGDIYAVERIISSTLRTSPEDFSPKKIKLFVWKVKH